MTYEHRFFGPPGTGKTRTLGRRVELSAQKFGSDNVVVASFTRAAAREVAGRKLPIPRENVATLHALAYRALGRPKVAKTADFSRQARGWQLSGMQTNPEEDDPLDVEANTEHDKLFQEYQALRARCTPRELWPVRVLQLAKDWEAWKAEQGAVDFSDMIELATSETDAAPGRPSVLYFDEAQDFTRAELNLCQRWGETAAYVVYAGDDDQCIYSFKGADSRNYVGGEHKTVLAQSYRVPRAVHAWANGIIHRVSLREPKEYLPRDADGAVERVGWSWRDPGPLLEDAWQRVRSGQSAMILAACSYMLHPVIDQLRARGIPFSNPWRAKRGDWNPLAGKARDRLLEFLRPNPEVWGDDARNWTTLDLEWLRVVKAKPRKAVEGAVGRYLEALLGDDEETKRALMCDLDWFEDSLLAQYKGGMKYPLLVAREHGGAVLRDEPRLFVGTIHSVKGGQADHVYLFPDVSRDAARAMQRVEGHDATTRLMYVAGTRAKERLVLCQAAGAGYSV